MSGRCVARNWRIFGFLVPHDLDLSLLFYTLSLFGKGYDIKMSPIYSMCSMNQIREKTMMFWIPNFHSTLTERIGCFDPFKRIRVDED